jgi:streptogramin lyase
VTVPRERLTVVHVDPKYQRVLAVIPIGTGPGAPAPIALDANAVWVPSAADGELVRIDPRTDTVTDRFPLPHGAEPTGIALAAGSVWIADAGAGDLLRVDPGSGRIGDRISADASGELATDGSTLWVVAGDAVVDVDATNAEVTQRSETCARPRGVAPAVGRVWVAGANVLCAIDPATGSSGAVAIEGAGLATAYGASVWVSVPSTGRVIRIDPA